MKVVCISVKWVEHVDRVKKIELKSWQSRYNEYKNEYKQEQTKTEPKKETTGNLKLDKILEKIKLRKEQLAKMKSNDHFQNKGIQLLLLYHRPFLSSLLFFYLDNSLENHQILFDFLYQI